MTEHAKPWQAATGPTLPTPTSELPPRHRCSCSGATVDPSRRGLLVEAVALASLAPLTARPAASVHAQSSRARKPEPGDRISYSAGDQQGKVIRVDELKVGDEPTLAYPMDPADGRVLESRANLLTVIRLEPAALQPASARNAADGIVVFSSLCTHAGCPVTSLHPSQTQLVCNCHGSIFDAANRGTVIQGPATRRLAMLPVEVSDGILIVTKKFDGPLGPPL